MPGLGTTGRLNSMAESEEFLAAVARQSIGRPCVVQPSKNLVGPTERRVDDGMEVSLRPSLRSTSSVIWSPPRDSSFKNEIGSLGAAKGRSGNKMAMAENPVQAKKSYARLSDPAPGPSQEQMAIARRTLSSTVVPLKPEPAQQPKAIPTVVAMAFPATTPHRLVHGERICHPQLPRPVPWRDLADRWQKELVAARERRKELKEQFRRDFRTEYGPHS